MTKYLLHALLLLFLYHPLALFSQEKPFINVVTEEFPPYNYTVKGKLAGGSYSVVKTVLEKLDYPYEIVVYPWARAYKKALRNKNTLIFSIGRNEKREKLFTWVGEIAEANNYLMKLKNRTDIEIKSLDDAKKYQVGSYIESMREQYLLSEGFVLGKNLQQNITYESNFLKLLLNRIDLWAVNEFVAYYILKKQGHEPQALLKKEFYLKGISEKGLYMAFNLKTDPKIVSDFKKALEEVRKEGKYEEIWKEYRFQ